MRAAAVIMGAALLLGGCGSEPVADQGAGTDASAAPAGQETLRAEPAGAASAVARPAAFAVCSSCHQVVPGKNAVGPSLHAVVGRQAGSLPGYNYSPAMKTSGKTWSEAELDAFIAAPRQVVPGTKMIFPGVPDPDRRRAIIAYLAQLK